jgi:adenylate kinase
MEEQKVYEVFESMMKDLMIDLPKEPVPYLLEKLKPENAEEQAKVIIMGPPGSRRKEHALSLAEYFNYESVSLGDLLKKEISKKSELGK